MAVADGGRRRGAGARGGRRRRARPAAAAHAIRCHIPYEELSGAPGGRRRRADDDGLRPPPPRRSWSSPCCCPACWSSPPPTCCPATWPPWSSAGKPRSRPRTTCARNWGSTSRSCSSTAPGSATWCTATGARPSAPARTCARSPWSDCATRPCWPWWPSSCTCPWASSWASSPPGGATPPLDHVLSAGSLAFIGLPEFVTAVLLIAVFSRWLGWLPSSSAIPPGTGFFDALPSLILPAMTVSLASLAYVVRMTRAGTIEVLQTDYVRTARLKGLPVLAVALQARAAQLAAAHDHGGRRRRGLADRGAHRHRVGLRLSRVWAGWCSSPCSAATSPSSRPRPWSS